MFKRKTVIKVTDTEIHFKDGSWGMQDKSTLLCGDVVRVLMYKDGQEIHKNNIKRALPLEYCKERPLNKMMSLDIEAVPVTKLFKEAPADVQEVFKVWLPKKLKVKSVPAKDLQKHWKEQAAFHPCCMKIVCISVGFISRGKDFCKFVSKSFFGNDEEQVVSDFADFVNETVRNNKFVGSLGHSLNPYDKPNIHQKALKYFIRIAPEWYTVGRPKWHDLDFHVEDVFKGPGMWGYSLAAQCAIYGIPTPKVTIDGSQVYGVWYRTNKSFKRSEIPVYCERDIKGNMQVAMPAYGIDPLVLTSESRTDPKLLEELNNLTK